MKVLDFSKLFPFFGKKQREAQSLLEKAKIDAKAITLKAREEALQTERDTERDVRKNKQQLMDLERKLQIKEAELAQNAKRTAQDKTLIEKERAELQSKKDEILLRLEKISNLSPAEAKEMILKGWEDKLKGEIAKRIRASEEEIKLKADEKAKELLVDALRFGAIDFVPEYTLSTITLPSDEYKGRIIGKEGRNIRSFELATGVDVDLEEEGVLKISSFDSVRREIARVSMERLLKDGRIQPPRIEEIVKKTKEDIEKIMIKAGEELCHSVGAFNVPAELVKLLGRFKYRFSYGQSMILHTMEETKIGIALAHELKADVMTVKLGCLLHDIGKIVVDEEGSHVQLGVDLLRKHNVSEAVIHTVAAHHEDIPFESVEAIIVYIADAISGGRPGARHEDLQEYVKRIKTIEEAAQMHPGVDQVYALQAGRELRVIVKPDQISDDESTILGVKIKEEIEKKFPTFPGQVTITVIRETRTVTTTHS